jgi:hypothetical protein
MADKGLRFVILIRWAGRVVDARTRPMRRVSRHDELGIVGVSAVGPVGITAITRITQHRALLTKSNLQSLPTPALL